MLLLLSSSLPRSAGFSANRLPQPAAHLAAPRRPIAFSCVAADDAEPIEVPLFDPRSDELPFPFPAPRPSNALEEDARSPSTYRYAFDRSIHLRLLRDALDDDGRPGARRAHRRVAPRRRHRSPTARAPQPTHPVLAPPVLARACRRRDHHRPLLPGGRRRSARARLN